MATIVDTFITQFDFKADLKGLDRIEKRVEKTTSSILTASNVIGAGVIALGAFARSTVMATIEVDRYAKGLSIATEQQSEFDFVAQAVGANVNTLRGHMFNLAQALNEASATGKGITDDLTRFGLSATDASGRTKDFATFLDEARRKLQTLEGLERADLVDKLGFDEETIAFLDLAPDRFAKLTEQARKYGVVTRQEAAAAREFNFSTFLVTTSVGKLGRIISTLVLPAASKMNELFADTLAFFNQHGRIIKVALSIGTLAAAYLNLGRIIALARSAFLVFSGPVGIAIAAVAALSFAFDDLIAYFEGADSLTGRLVSRFPELGAVIETVRETVVNAGNSIFNFVDSAIDKIKALGPAFAEVGAAFASVLGGIGVDSEAFTASLVAIKDAAVTIFKAILDGWGLIGDVVLQMLDNLGPMLKAFAEWVRTSDTLKESLSVVARAVSGLVNAGGKLAGFISRFFGGDRGTPTTTAPVAAPVYVGPGPGPGGGQSVSTNVENININMQNGNSREVASNVDGALKEHMRNTARSMDSGFIR